MWPKLVAMTGTAWRDESCRERAQQAKRKRQGRNGAASCATTRKKARDGKDSARTRPTLAIKGTSQAMAHAVKRIGLISDTHGLLRKEALEALRGSQLIIHAGDVGKREILEELRKIASVVAVRGNVDTEPWAKALPETAVAEAGSVLIYVLHDVNALD